MPKKEKSFIAEVRSWQSKNGLHGPHAFLRFVMLVFVDLTNMASDEFVFKGGNLLWVYIKTPRSTVDIDFATKNLADHKVVFDHIQKVCDLSQSGKVSFSIVSFDEVGSHGAGVKIGFETEQGQKNTFDIDIVYSVPTVSSGIPSPVGGEGIVQVATMENIISDKLATCHRFKSGNTRMKDYDDLWRISKVGNDRVSVTLLTDLLSERKISAGVDLDWVTDDMRKMWESHSRRNKGLPKKLDDTLDDINDWLSSLLTS